MVIINWGLWLAPGLFTALILIGGWLFVCHAFNGIMTDISAKKAGFIVAGAVALASTCTYIGIDRGIFPYKNDTINELERKLDLANGKIDELSKSVNAADDTDEKRVQEIKKLNAALQDSSSMCLGYRENNELLKKTIGDWAEQYNNLAAYAKKMEAAASLCAATEIKDRQARGVECGKWPYSTYKTDHGYHTTPPTILDTTYDFRLSVTAMKPDKRTAKVVVMDQTQRFEFDVTEGHFSCYVTPHYNVQVEAIDISQEGARLRVWYKGVY